MKITDKLLGWFSRKDLATSIFEPATQPGVPKNNRMAMDDALLGWANEFYSELSLISMAKEGQAFLGFPTLAAMAQRGEYRRITETIAMDMTRKWIRIKSKGEGDEKAEKISQLNDAIKEFELKDLFKKIVEQDGYFGRGHLYIDTGDGENRLELLTSIGDGRGKLSKGKVGKGKIKRFSVVEAMWAYPQKYDTRDPLSPDWYNPQTWLVQGKEIHKSRLLPFVGRPVPDLLKPAYSFGGLSLSQMAKPYVENWLRTRQSVSDMLHSFSVSGLKTNLADKIAEGAEEEIYRRVQFFNAARDNNGMMIVDKNLEEYFNVSAPLGTLDVLQAQSLESICSISGIPVVKYVGNQPVGLNASSEGELEAYYTWVHSQQEKMTPLLNSVLALLQLHLFGEFDPDLIWEYEALWSETSKEKADRRKVEADIDISLVEAGVLDRVEVRHRIVEDEESPYNGLDPDEIPEPPTMNELEPPIMNDPEQAA
jgi:phage-related protein (TIGR01555 family)